MIDSSTCVERFKALFNAMSSGQLGDLADVYGEGVRFADPFVSIVGLHDLRDYFEDAYSNVISCEFTFEAAVEQDGGVCLPWVMNLRHRRIRRGQLIAVDGISRLSVVDDRIVFHRDYFDAGQLLYENLPVLGVAVRWIRKNAA